MRARCIIYKRCEGTFAHVFHTTVPTPIIPLCQNMRFSLSPLCALLLAAFVVALPVSNSHLHSVWLLHDLLAHIQTPENDIKRESDFIGGSNHDFKRNGDFINNHDYKRNGDFIHNHDYKRESS